LSALTLSNANATEINSIKTVKKTLLKRIQCNRESTTPPSDGLGSLWGCYSQNEEAKLWINGIASEKDAIRNIKFMVVNYHSRKMDITGKIWNNIISEELGGKNSEEMKKVFHNCPSNKTFNSTDREIVVKCSKGLKADEHLIIVYPK